MVLTRFLPKDEQFFGHFDEAAANAAETATLLLDMVEHVEDRDRKARRLRDLEHHGDEITHRVYSALNSTFVTPLDRDDIQQLAHDLDDVVDALEEAGKRLLLYKMGKSTESAKLLAKIAAEQCTIIAKAVPMIERVAKEATDVRTAVLDIHRLENEADEALSRALAASYDGVTDVPGLIVAMRWNELYHLLEDATDGAEHVANAIEGILLKNA